MNDRLIKIVIQPGLRVSIGIVAAWCLSAFPWAASAGDGSSTNSPLLTVDRVFDGDEWNGDTAPAIVWSKRGKGYYVFEKAFAGGSGKDLVLTNPETDGKELVAPSHAFTIPGEFRSLGIDSFELSEDESKILIFTNSRRVWRQNTRGDYWVYDITSRELRKLGGDASPSSLMFAKFSKDGTRVAFVRENNIYVQQLRDMSLLRLTHDGSTHVINGTFDWVYEEELYLRDGFLWSPDGSSIAYWQLDSKGVREFQMMNNTDSFYPKTVPLPYPKTGEENSAARIGVIPSKGGETQWMSVPGDPRNHYLARLHWASNSTELLIQQFNRWQTTNRVMLANARSGEVKTLFEETDGAWVENENAVRWIEKGKRFLWLSERDGWQHVYRASREGGAPSRVTKGDFDVIAIVELDAAQEWLYFTASPENPTQRFLFRVKLSGGKPERLTPADQPGTHSYILSPDCRWAMHTYSTFNRPPVTDLIRLPDHTSVRVLEDNKKLTEKLASLKPVSTEFFRIEIGDKILLDAWCIRPPDFDAAKRYPVVFHVYGEPAAQTVLDSWAGKRALWHRMLAQQGYLVMSVDNRGTPAPRGREWRRALRQNIGILNPADQAAATQAILKRWDYVDPSRVGIWGWSGGGSSTLNALFQYPDLYQTGMSIAPVPNQRYYDTIYQERYMGLPDESPDGYRRGSPISHAHKLKGNLLIIHGTGDDNVHYQGLEALVNELVSNNKPFTMMAYPNRTHSISEGKNTTRHLYGLLTRFLNQNLEPGGKPR